MEIVGFLHNSPKGKERAATYIPTNQSGCWYLIRYVKLLGRCPATMSRSGFSLKVDVSTRKPTVATANILIEFAVVTVELCL